MKLICSCGLWRHLDIELLNAKPVHNAGRAKVSAMDRTPAAYRELAPIRHLAEEEYFLFRLLLYRHLVTHWAFTSMCSKSTA
jgi:hypothetical protein